MSQIFAALGLQDSDRSFVNTIGQTVVYGAAQRLLAQHNLEVRAAYNLFVGERTDTFKRRYKLAGGGFLQKRSRVAPVADVKASGYWDVAFPLEDFAAGFGLDDITVAYMRLPELNNHLDTIMNQNVNTYRLEMLKALFCNTVYSFKDEINGDLSVQPLANGDAVKYPAVVGSNTEASDNHYLVSGYAAASISNTNNPFKTIKAELVEHFGASAGGNNIIVFINSAQESAIEDLDDFDPVNDRFTIPGANVPQLMGVPDYVPGVPIGRIDGCWVVVWDYIPSGYMFGIFAESYVDKPLIERVDLQETGLPVGLTLISTKQDENPLEHSTYRNRFGFGAGNRLNGVVMFLDAGSTYTIPTGFTR